MRERDIEKWLKSRIEGMGGEFWKFTSPGRDGVPDRIAIFPDGRLVFVELKSEHGTLKELQKRQIRRLWMMHQQVCVVYGKAGATEFLRDMKDHSVSSWVYYSDGDGHELYEV